MIDRGRAERALELLDRARVIETEREQAVGREGEARTTLDDETDRSKP